MALVFRINATRATGNDQPTATNQNPMPTNTKNLTESLRSGPNFNLLIMKNPQTTLSRWSA
jgi:hypothetical protein